MAILALAVGKAVVRVVFLYKDSSAPPTRPQSSVIVMMSEVSNTYISL